MMQGEPLGKGLLRWHIQPGNTITRYPAYARAKNTAKSSRICKLSRPLELMVHCIVARAYYSNASYFGMGNVDSNPSLSAIVRVQ